MAILYHILYFLVIGTLLAAGYLVQAHEVKLLTLKSIRGIFSWLSNTSGKVPERTKVSKTSVIQESISLAGCSREWWEDDGLFQLEKRAIFSKVRLQVLRNKQDSDYSTTVMALGNACMQIPETWRLPDI